MVNRTAKRSRMLYSWLVLCVLALGDSIGTGCAASSNVDGTRPRQPRSRGREAGAERTHSDSSRRRASLESAQRSLSLRAGSSSQPTSATANKKYTAAAEEAMKTLNSFASKNRQPTMPNLLSESALMDKETNAIYWQGGADIFSTSLATPYLTQRGVLHVKGTILTIALWLWVWGHASRYLASTYFESTAGGARGHKLLFSLPFISPDSVPPFLQKVASFIAPVIPFCLLLVHSLLYLRLPQYSTKVLVATMMLYLLESYTCSTRRYLWNAMNAPSEVEAYLERIRKVAPCVTWKVRCFHYEEREFWKSWNGIGKVLGGWMNKNAGDGDGNSNMTSDTKPSAPSSSGTFGESPPPWMARKVVTHQAVGTYKFGSWEDNTLASLWKRSQSFSATTQEAPFSKMSLSKLLVLKDKSAREDYFAQQAAFVMLEGRKDVHAEFATTIDVEGFRPKILAVRPVRQASKISAALFRQHVYILFTLLGLSLPYRLWFAKHCDEIRVAVVKETSNTVSASEVETPEKSSWFRGKWTRSAVDDRKKAQELFKKSMQQFALYGEEPSSVDSTAGQPVNAVEDTAPVLESGPGNSDEGMHNEAVSEDLVSVPGADISDESGGGDAATVASMVQPESPLPDPQTESSDSVINQGAQDAQH